MTPSRRRLTGLLFAAQFAVAEACLEGARGYHARPALVVGVLTSLSLWGLVWTSRRRGVVRWLASLVAASVMAVDAFVVRYYGTTLDRHVVLSAMHNWADVRPIVTRLLPWAVALGLVVLLVEMTWLRAGGATEPWEATLRVALAALVAIGLSSGLGAGTTPDLRALASLPWHWTRDPSAATTPTAIAELPSTRTRLPNVLFVLTESVRASSYCSAPTAGCSFTPDLDRVLPQRIPLRQMRSIASYTAVSAAALFTGRTQEGPREELASAPTIFDYARQVRRDGERLHVAYYSAQSAGVLERDVRGSVDAFVSLETLLGHSVDDEDDVVPLGIDRLLRDRFLRDLPSMSGPLLVVLHLAGTHAPYYVDDARAPFRPIVHVVTWSGLPELRNAYEDAIVAQDTVVASCVSAFIARTEGEPWLIVLTSDHGEAFGEHAAIHHGQNLYDEQIHVPAWIAYGGGALEGAEMDALRAHRGSFVTQLDLLPTVLDALGVWRSLALAPQRARLQGVSLLGAENEASAIPMTNCTGLFPCPLNTWGMLGGDHALLAQPWDGDWNCVSLSSEEEHVHDAACDALRTASREPFATLPNGRANAR